MSNSKYAALCAAVETGSLTRAAERLGYTQSGVSHLIRTLEDELGFALLVRARGGVVLTDEGQRLMPYIRQVLAAERDISRLSAELRGLSSGVVRVGTFSSVAVAWMPGLIHRFGALHPGVRIEVFNATYAPLELALAQDQVDCAFVTLPSRDEFAVTPLFRDRLMAVVRADAPLAVRAGVTAKELAALPYIVPAEGTDYDAGKVFTSMGAAPRVRFDVGDDYAAAAMVRKGLGFTILPELLLQGMELDAVRAIPLENSARCIALAVNRARYLSPAAQSFVAFVRETVPLLAPAAEGASPQTNDIFMEQKEDPHEPF